MMSINHLLLIDTLFREIFVKARFLESITLIIHGKWADRG